MMKKILITVLISLSFFQFSSFTNPIYAACTGLNSRGQCNPGQHACGGSSCCSSDQECQAQQNTTTQTIDKGERDSLSLPAAGLLCNNGGQGIQTAIGCIPVLGGQDAFLSFILSWAIGIGGGIAFLLIVYAGFMIMSSQGNPDRLKAGQELLTSAISGLVLLVLSVFILNIIGVKILQIPGFAK